MSAYKTQELLDICNKLGIETNVASSNNDANGVANTENAVKNKSKKDLYESIIKYF
jgi:hypothetical protein